MPTQLPLKELHPESSLSRAKLMQLDLATTDELKIASARPKRLFENEARRDHSRWAPPH